MLLGDVDDSNKKPPGLLPGASTMRAASVLGSKNLRLRPRIGRVKGEIANRFPIGFVTRHDIDLEFRIDVAGRGHHLSIQNEDGNRGIDRKRNHIPYCLFLRLNQAQKVNLKYRSARASIR